MPLHNYILPVLGVGILHFSASCSMFQGGPEYTECSSSGICFSFPSLSFDLVCVCFSSSQGLQLQASYCRVEAIPEGEAQTEKVHRSQPLTDPLLFKHTSPIIFQTGAGIILSSLPHQRLQCQWGQSLHSSVVP